MYTQCPECEAAFRVTAEVLKQAAGMVRCGSCGHAFNSLAYLSEKKPEPKIPDPSIPELVPEPSSESPPTPPEPSPGPQSISAEQSAALLKTLDQLAGEDIRIEDTGVEWRVLDEKDVDDEPLADSNEQDILSDPEVTSAFRTEDEPQEATSPDLRHTDVFEPAATMVDEQGLFDDGNTQVDELLDEAPTPVDEFLSAEPADGAAAEAVDLDLGALLDDLESDDDHDIQAELDALPETPAVSEPVSVEESANTGDDDDPAPVDEATDSEPEWSADAVEYSDSETAQDFDDMPADEAAHVVEESAEPEAVEPVLRFDDNTPLPEDFLDEAVPVAAAPVDAVPAIDGPDPEALQKDIELGKADEWQALLDEFGDLLATDLDANDEQGEQKADDDWGELSEEAVDAELSRELDSLEADAGEEDADEPETHDSVTDEAIELETLDENQSDEADDHPHEAADDLIEAEAETDEPADNIIEAVTDEPANNVIEVEAKTDESIDDEQPVAEAIAEASLDEDQPAADDHVDDEQSQDEISDEAAADIEASELDIAAELYDGEPLPVDDDGGLDLTGILDPDDDGLEDHGEVDANPDDQGMPEIIELGDEPEEQPVDAPGPGHPHYVPPPSEEEQTINMLIDQDLLAIAHEDDEGFTSTIVFEQGAEPTDVDSIIMGGDDDDQPANDDVPEDDEMLAEAGTWAATTMTSRQTTMCRKTTRCSPKPANRQTKRWLRRTSRQPKSQRKARRRTSVEQPAWVRLPRFSYWRWAHRVCIKSVSNSRPIRDSAAPCNPSTARWACR